MSHRHLRTPDVLVIGLGAMGSATVQHLARRGVKVVGLDQYAPPHAYGSSHGETRITRQAVGEGEAFVPLVMRSQVLWRELEDETRQTLFTRCGCLIMGREGQANWLHDQPDFLGNTIRVARKFGIAHETLSTTEIAARFPQFVLDGDEAGYYEDSAGSLNPEACVTANLMLATRHGAALRYGETVQSIQPQGSRHIVETDQGCYTPGTTIACAGPWLPTLVPALAASLVVRRQVLYWFQLNRLHASDYTPDRFPVFIWPWGGDEAGREAFYGFPQFDRPGDVASIKVATEQREFATTAAMVDRRVTPAEKAAMYSQHIQGHLRGVGDVCIKSAACLYTNAPRAHFLIDRLPDAPNVVVVSACSGHGFKHSAAIGEAVAQMVITGHTPPVLAPFAWPTMMAQTKS